MMKKNKKRWTQIKLLLFVPILLLLLQAFARPELISNPENFIPVQFQENNSEKWIERWTMQNIGEGIFQPEINASELQKEPNNVLVILMNRKDQYLIENQHKKREYLKQLVKNYLHGINPDGGKGPDFSEKEIPLIGKIKVSDGMVTYKHDIASSPKMINSTLKAIGEAYLEVRNEKAQIFFGNNYLELNDEKQKAVNMAVPVWFEFDKPKTIKPPPPPPPLSIELKKDGSLALGPKKNKTQYSFEEFVNKLPEIEKNYKEFNEKHNVNYPYYCRIDMQEGADDNSVKKLKEVLGKFEIIFE